MRSELLGVERRRFWRDEDKLEVVLSVGGAVSGCLAAKAGEWCGVSVSCPSG
jgi:hypothetical protein